MKIFRRFISLVLVLVATLLVSCSSSTKAKIPTTYSPEKIAQLQTYVEPVNVAREKMNTLKTLIENKNWVDTRSFIHGPLGQLRQDMSILSRKLLPKDQGNAEKLAQELFQDIERLDAAAKDRNINMAASQYFQAAKDFDSFLDLIPE